LAQKTWRRKAMRMPHRPILDPPPWEVPDAPEDGTRLPSYEDDRAYLEDHWRERYDDGE
jgi:hypothetical protein